jgi:uncharacterized protein YdhG (YjbR/CyaY superfamily)
MNTVNPSSIDDYISRFPENTQILLEQIRLIIKKSVPAAQEKISYDIPTFTLNNTYLIYFAAFKNHVSIYPAPLMAEDFRKDFAPYKQGKGTIQFPLDKPLPFELITKIIEYRIKENKDQSKRQNHHVNL